MLSNKMQVFNLALILILRTFLKKIRKSLSLEKKSKTCLMTLKKQRKDPLRVHSSVTVSSCQFNSLMSHTFLLPKMKIMSSKLVTKSLRNSFWKSFAMRLRKLDLTSANILNSEILFVLSLSCLIIRLSMRLTISKMKMLFAEKNSRSCLPRLLPKKKLSKHKKRRWNQLKLKKLRLNWLRRKLRSNSNSKPNLKRDRISSNSCNLA
mmetsp:Transcript_49182/g.66932  ORF Transcript_49182/g.66932 Transcript_49182/m.66932 type:complete len:207 (+) Transcript_49182:671-1291(+)